MGLYYRGYECSFVPKSILEKQFISIGHALYITAKLLCLLRNILQYFILFYIYMLKILDYVSKISDFQTFMALPAP